MHLMKGFISTLLFSFLFSSVKTECYDAATKYSSDVLGVEACAVAFKDNDNFYTVVMQCESGEYFTVDVSLLDYSCCNSTYSNIDIRDNVTEEVKRILKDYKNSVIVMFPESNSCICSVKVSNKNKLSTDDLLKVVDYLKSVDLLTTLTCEYVEENNLDLFDQLASNWLDVGEDFNTYNTMCDMCKMLCVPIYHADFYDVEKEISSWLSK